MLDCILSSSSYVTAQPRHRVMFSATHQVPLPCLSSHLLDFARQHRWQFDPQLLCVFERGREATQVGQRLNPHHARSLFICRLRGKHTYLHKFCVEKTTRWGFIQKWQSYGAYFANQVTFWYKVLNSSVWRLKGITEQEVHHHEVFY